MAILVNAFMVIPLVSTERFLLLIDTINSYLGDRGGAVGDLTNCHRSITILDNRRINYSSRNVLEKKIAWFVIYPKLSVIGMYVFMASIFFLIPPGLMIFLY